MKSDKFILITAAISCAFLFSLSSPKFVFSAQKGEKVIKHSVVEKEILGVVTGISKRNISICYSVDGSGENEILIPYDAEKLQTQHKRHLSEINVGDTAKVIYDEDFKKFESGREDVKLKARVVSFVRAAPVKAVNPEVLNSEGQSAGE